jgi:hypothetical protein
MAKKIDLSRILKRDLGYKFEGKNVVGARFIVRGTGDGLSKAQAVDPVVIPQGQRVIVAFEVDTAEIRHDPFDKDELDGDQVRIHIGRAESAVILPAGAAFDAVKKELAGQSKRVDKAVEEAEGVQRLEGIDDVDPAKAPATKKSPRKARGTRKSRSH